MILSTMALKWRQAISMASLVYKCFLRALLSTGVQLSRWILWGHLKTLKYMHLFLVLMSILWHYSKVFYTLATVSASEINKMKDSEQIMYTQNKSKRTKIVESTKLREIKFHCPKHAARRTHKDVFICWKMISYCVCSLWSRLDSDWVAVSRHRPFETFKENYSRFHILRYWIIHQQLKY